MAVRMPSPIGHALAGLAIGIAAEPLPSTSRLRTMAHLLPVAGALMAASPDLDLLVPGFHRTATHSLAMTALVMIIAMVVTGQVNGRIWWRFVLVVGAAHASHVLLDWLGDDPSMPSGLEALWPFSTRFYLSGVNWFPSTERRLFTAPGAFAINARALAVELSTLGPVVCAAWWARRRRRSPGRLSGQGVPQRPFV
jgi:membrane-bound metal-dependent hydrolase YbcI (DUF457 family)